MKPIPDTDRYSPQEIDDYYGSACGPRRRSMTCWSGVQENTDEVFATDGTRSLTFRQLFDGARQRPSVCTGRASGQMIYVNGGSGIG